VSSCFSSILAVLGVLALSRDAGFPRPLEYFAVAPQVFEEDGFFMWMDFAFCLDGVFTVVGRRVSLVVGPVVISIAFNGSIGRRCGRPYIRSLLRISLGYVAFLMILLQVSDFDCASGWRVPVSLKLWCYFLGGLGAFDSSALNLSRWFEFL
ncbi:hypothetical protein A2U01_0001215, partial [Trifolium medium]|nr:hypothetical protein [Trifolium medium]